MAEGARRLLGPDEPAPVWLLRSDGRADFVLTADHAGRAIPRALSDLGLPESERLRHIAWDIGIAAVTERLAAALDAVAVMQRYSRLVIDCNRSCGRHLAGSPPIPAVGGQRAKPSCRPELRTMRSWRPEIVAIPICVGSSAA